MNPLKILTLCYEYPPIGGGAAKVVDGIIRQLIKKGHSVDLVTMNFRGLAKTEIHDNLRIHRVSCGRLSSNICSPAEMFPYLINSKRLLNRLCTKNYYDLVHAHFILPDGHLAQHLWRRFKLPYVITSHGSDVSGYNPDRFKLLHKLITPAWRTIASNAKVVIFPSLHLKHLAEKKHIPTPTTIIPNGFDLQKFSPYSPKKNCILVVTHMFERKGVQFLLHALQGMNHDWEITIVGDGPYLPVLQRMARDLEVPVSFLGFLGTNSQELKNLYEKSRIFVFTSESENFPTVLLEAMAAGMAIITSQGNGCTEVVGDTAVLVEPRNGNALQVALTNLMSNPSLCKEIGLQTRKRLETHFGWSAVTDSYVSLFQQYAQGTP